MVLPHKTLYKKVNQLILDIFVFSFAIFAAFFIRFEGIPPGNNLRQLLILFPYIVLARILLFRIFSVYSIVWKYISINDAILIFKASSPITVLLFLGRSVVSFEKHLPEVTNRYRNKRILVTGAGGSIGAELCRQLAPLWPKELIMLDKDENSIFEIDSELNGESNGYNLSPLIADIRSFERLEFVFKICRPEVVFHAAAHKHVPLMELNVSEAVLNNVLGTKNVTRLAVKYGVKNFVYISTDKAVNPTSVMGASKKVGYNRT